MSQNPKAYPTYSERIFSAGGEADLFSQSLTAQRTLKTEYPGIRHIPNAMG